MKLYHRHNWVFRNETCGQYEFCRNCGEKRIIMKYDKPVARNLNTKYIGLLLGFICSLILVSALLDLWVENQTYQMRYDRCIEVVKMYKNAKG